MNRYDVRRASGTTDRSLGFYQSPEQERHNDRMSKAAELWACHYYAADDSIILGNEPDPGYDFVVGRHRVDVKWQGKVPPSYPVLIYRPWKEQTAEIQMMVCGVTEEDFDRYEWAHGWATLAEVQAAPWGTVPGKPYRALGFDFLHRLEELVP